MNVYGDLRVGKSFWVRFQLLSIDPKTEVALSDGNASEGSVRLVRPDGTEHPPMALGEGLQNLADGWYAAALTADVAGRHKILLAMTGELGLTERVEKEIVIYDFG